MKRHKKKFWFAFPLILTAIGLFIWFFQWLWNALLPDILGVKSISYWQAFGILLLSKILFGGMNFKKHDGKFRRKMREHFSDEDRMKFRNEWAERWRQRFCEQDFSDEERTKFRDEWIEKMREKCKRP